MNYMVQMYTHIILICCFEETVRRHNTRNREFGEKDMRRWWREKDFSSVLREQAITCEMDTDSIVEKIYSDLGLSGNDSSKQGQI